MADDPTAAELVEQLSHADIVIALSSDGDQQLLKGKDLLEEIVAAGESERARIVPVRVRNTYEAEVIAAAILVIQDGQMGDAQVARFQSLLDNARGLH